MTQEKPPLRIGIVGAGFAGTSLAAHLHEISDRPLNIILFEKKSQFGVGDAYNTPYPFHLLNVRAKDMSAFEHKPKHFVSWLEKNNHYSLEPSSFLSEQFVPRLCYRDYLQHLLTQIQTHSNQVQLHLESTEIIDVIASSKEIVLVSKENKKTTVDKLILATGNNPPASFPFPVSKAMRTINNPWDFTAPLHIAAEEAVLIVGTGLSMVDAVLTLHHQGHQGKIYVLSRHGLLPLPHRNKLQAFDIDAAALPSSLRGFAKHLRQLSQQCGDWRSVVNGVRPFIATWWQKATIADKKRFLRHAAPYWNVHRHRLPDSVADLLANLAKKKQFILMKGRVLAVYEHHAKIKQRSVDETMQIKVDWLINCMGPAHDLTQSSLLMAQLLQKDWARLDELRLGLQTDSHGALINKNGQQSLHCFAIGPLRKASLWETSAVPEIRSQCFALAKHLLNP